MKDEEIFELAETHGWLDDFGRWNFMDDHLLDFVDEIRKEEREACARVCEQMSWPGRSDEALWKDDASDECAKAIRARGNHD